MDPDDIIRASLGQRYRELPFRERFGDWPEDERQEGIRRLLEEFNAPPPPAGFDVIDPSGYRGVRHPTGYYLLKGI
jgi:hypothetical protein